MHWFDVSKISVKSVYVHQSMCLAYVLHELDTRVPMSNRGIAIDRLIYVHFTMTLNILNHKVHTHYSHTATLSPFPRNLTQLSNWTAFVILDWTSYMLVLSSKCCLDNWGNIYINYIYVYQDVTQIALIYVIII